MIRSSRTGGAGPRHVAAADGGWVPGMGEPSWERLRDRLVSMTVRELRGVGRRWFAGSLGGASTKAAIADEMVSQMRHWWRMPEGYGRARVENVMADIDETIGGRE